MRPNTLFESKPAGPENLQKDLLFGLAAAFGAVGAAGVLDLPPILYVIPLGFGAAGLVLTAVALGLPGRMPWWSAVAILASIAGLIADITAYADFQDAKDQVQEGL